MPKPKESQTHMFIFSLKSLYVRDPNDLGNVMLRSHVDALGRHNSSVKQTIGVQLKPAAGSLVDPETKCRISPNETFPLSVGNKCNQYK